MEEECYWCGDLEFAGDVRCLSQENLLSSRCVDVQKPTSSYNGSVETQGSNPIDVSTVFLNLAVGDSQEFTVVVTPNENAPLDLYILMDLSASMETNLETVQQISNQIAMEISEVTNNVRLGFGTFNDKPTFPYTNVFFMADEGKDNYYSFIHRISLTDNTTSFVEAVSQSFVTTNADDPENVLEALLQVVVCEKDIGWRDRNSMAMDPKERGLNRVVLLMTDDQFHFAGEGKFAEILQPVDKMCRLEPYDNDQINEVGKREIGDKIYNAWSEYDYPSLGMMVQVLKEYQVIPIFAIAPQVNETYMGLVDYIRTVQTASFAEFAEESGNILELIRTELNNVLRSVRIANVENELYRLEVTPMCGSGESVVEVDGGCEGVKFGDSVSFKIDMTLLSCDQFQTQDVMQITVFVFGFGFFHVNVTGLCSCNCEDQVEVASPECNGGRGNFSCGVCDCDPEWCGPRCETPASMAMDCPVDPVNDLVCSGRGECDCKNCICRFIQPNDPEVKPPEGIEAMYLGDACQCINFEVCNVFNGSLCGGDRGMCTCDGCMCDMNSEYGFQYTGNSGESNDCGCPRDIEDCYDFSTNVTQLCNGNGHCLCPDSICLCNEGFGGKYCLPLGPTQDCVDIDEDCIVQIVDESATTCDGINATFDTVSEVPMEARSCSYQRGDCTYSYWVGSANDPIYVVPGRDCAFPSYLIAIIVVAGIIVLGIILLIIIKLLFVVLDYIEVKRWQRDLKEADFSKNQNPLYQSPESKYVNVAYGKPI